MRGLTLSIPSLSCQTCVNAVSAAVRPLLGGAPTASEHATDSVEPIFDLATKRATMHLPSSVTEEDVLAAIAAPPCSKIATVVSTDMVDSSPRPRRLTLSLSGLSCSSCVPSVLDAISALLASSEYHVAPPDIRFPERTATVVLPPSISEDALLAAIAATGPTRRASITSSNPLSYLPRRSSSHASPSPSVERRYRCGCQNLSCRCSSTLVIPGDPGVLVSVIVNGTAFDSSCDSCQCAETDICSCSVDIPTGPKISPDLRSASSIASATSSAHETRLSVAKTSQRTLTITGMTCAACVAVVRDLLMSLPGVQSASVTLLMGRAVIQVVDAHFRLSQAVKTLENAGYRAATVRNADTDTAAVYLRFSNHQVAESACRTLREVDGVFSAHIWQPPNSSRGEPTPKRDSSHSSCSSSDLSNKTRTKSRAHNAFVPAWVSSRRKQIDQPLPVVRLVSDAKLAAADRLLKEEIGYQVIPRTDPLLTGSETASDLLRREANQYARGFYGALLFTLPLALLTMVFAKVPALGSHALKQYVGSTGFRVIDLVAFTLATPVQFVFGFRFYRGSFYALKRARANMDVLIALGTTIAYAFSIVIPILNTVQIRKGLDITTEIMAFETSALLITIVLLGKWMQSIAKRKTAVGIEALAKLAPRSVTVVSEPPAATELFPQPVDPELVSIGDFFRVNPGASFPLDGVVEQGCTHVDESMLTGESWPVEKAAGHQVYSGTINKGNSVIVRCSATGTDSMLEKIVDLVKRAQASRAPVEAFADRVSAVFVPVVLVIALFATLLWFTLAKTNAIPSSWADGEGDFLFGVLFGLSVLVIACPCALGLATPTVIMMAASVGARKFGILYKDGGEALQAAHKAKAVLFDKTGTLTMGKPIVTCAVPVQIGQNDVSLISNSSAASSIASDFICSIAAAESHSDHPLARALCAYAENHSTADSIEIVTKDSESLAGRGIRCRLEDNRTVVVGKQEWVIEEMQSHTKRPMRLSSACDSMISQWEQVGRTVVWAFVSDNQAAIFGIEDPVRSESRSVIHELRKRGMECGIVTGDSIGTAQNVARIVGIDECDVYARALPTEKVEVVRKLSCRSVKKGSHQDGKDGVVFVGDGINDAGALSAASVGIAMGCGTQIATESAGIVLVKSNLRDVIIALDLARVAFHRIKLNYVWALGFNCLGIPLAAGAAFPLLQTRIPPYAAAAAMGLSSVAVVLCSLSLGLYRAPNLAEQEPNQEPTVSAT